MQSPLSVRRRIGGYRPRRPFASPGRAGRDWHRAAAQVGASVLVATGGVPASPGGWGGSGPSRRRPGSVSVITRQSVDGRTLQVETSSAAADDWWRDEQMLLWRWLSEWQQSFSQARREAPVQFPIHVEAYADRWQQDVEADGIAEPFTFVGNPEVWVARGVVGGRQVEVTSQGWPCAGLALLSVSPKDVQNRG